MGVSMIKRILSSEHAAKWRIAGIAIIITLAAQGGLAQDAREVPPVVPGAKPAWLSTSRFAARHSKAIWKGMRSIAKRSCFCRPAITKQKHRRYPVVYALHGFTDKAEWFTHDIGAPQTMEGAWAKGSQEMIVVLPDSYTVYGGSMYSSSVTTGDYEKFIAHDVVAYIDAHYRTIPNRV